MESFEMYTQGADDMKKNCLQPNSRLMYEKCIKQYKEYTSKIESFPLTSTKIVSFFEFLRIKQKLEFTTIQNYLHSFSHYIRMNRLQYPVDPTKSSEVAEYMKGLIKNMHGGFPPNRKEGITIKDLEKISQIIDK